MKLLAALRRFGRDGIWWIVVIIVVLFLAVTYMTAYAVDGVITLFIAIFGTPKRKEERFRFMHLKWHRRPLFTW